MALTDPQDTLAYHQARVFTTHRSMADVPLAKVSAALKKYMNSAIKKDVSPEREALAFYGMNHLMAHVQAKYAPLEPLPPDALGYVNAYHKDMGSAAIRAFYYLLIICVREARHNKSLVKDTPKLQKLFGEEVANFHNAGSGESGGYSTLLNKPPACTIGALTKSLCWVFYHSKWTSGYGGPAWGKVTDCLDRFVHGEFTAEMMMDTIWTLAHNNGPIFNKGHLYQGYSGYLIRLLDIQRSGQIPEAVLSDDLVFNSYGSKSLLAAMQWLKSQDSKIGEFVDWWVVEALGSVQKYPTEKKEQAAKHGMSAKASEAEKQAIAVAEAKAKAILQKKLDDAKKIFVVMQLGPGTMLQVKKFEKDRAA